MGKEAFKEEANCFCALHARMALLESGEGGIHLSIGSWCVGIVGTGGGGEG